MTEVVPFSQAQIRDRFLTSECLREDVIFSDSTVIFAVLANLQTC
jgi:hypothetical protein